MKGRKLKVAGLFVFILVLTFSMAACDMVGENAVEDTAGEAVDDSGTGELEVVVSGENMDKEVGAQSVVYNRFTDFELEFYIEYQDNTDINYTETISIDDAAVLEDNLEAEGDGYSVVFTALKESDWNVEVTLTGYNVNTEEEGIVIATGETVTPVINGMKEDVTVPIEQETGDLDISLETFPSEETGGEIIEDVNVKLLDLDGETVLGEMDFNYGEEGENLLVEDLYPTYYTMVVSWEGHGSVEEEIQVRVVPGKTKEIPINLFGSQIIVDADWTAEPECPENIMVEQNEDGFLISWDGVDNADSYNVLRKRDPYFHDDFAKVGEVEDDGDIRYEYQYDVEKPILFDIASYDFQVVAAREHDGNFDLTSEACGPSEFALDRATAWAGDSEGDGEAGWWYYYDTEGPAEQTIFVNGSVGMGTVELTENDDDTVTIELTIDDDDWDIQDDVTDEVLKVQGYADGELPSERPEPNFFDYQFDHDDLEIDGDTISVDVPAEDYKFFGIKIDVMGTIYQAGV